MLALTKLTMPGPFGARTREMGDYFGIRGAGTLAAMAGERLRLPGYTEISAVCTHPDHLGRGYASALMEMLMERICSRGELPFLHVRSENARAIQVYERLGFRIRASLHYVVLRHRRNRVSATNRSRSRSEESPILARGMVAMPASFSITSLFPKNKTAAISRGRFPHN